ncbi:hypothetical protein KR222_005635, partial [Zaprionus bogoriensis]
KMEHPVFKRAREYYNRIHGIEQESAKKETLGEQMERFRQEVYDLLTRHKVPYTKKEDEDTYEDYLLSDDEDSNKTKNQKRKIEADSDGEEDVDERIASIKNKLRQKKRPTTERQQKKREAKKLKHSKGVQKLLQSSAKTLKNENIKQQKLKTAVVKTEKGSDAAGEDSKALIQPVKVQPVYNEEAKIVYSKIDFAANPGKKAKKSHQNPKEILKKLKDTRLHINELKEQGETDKAAEIQNEIAWKKAFDKIEGKKVKDDTKLLQKAIKKRKVEKRVAKKKWTDRKQKVEHDIAKRQKKRQENLDKRSKDKKNKKLKKASKKGRIIPGY